MQCKGNELFSKSQRNIEKAKSEKFKCYALSLSFIICHISITSSFPRKKRNALYYLSFSEAHKIFIYYLLKD